MGAPTLLCFLKEITLASIFTGGDVRNEFPLISSTVHADQNESCRESIFKNGFLFNSENSQSFLLGIRIKCNI